ncbi:sce7725 family protein [Bdellovibrio sp.]|uniref:sce7725 family protein n=1 Tax=Bdellovibrio sp. TaxID=28201 RepID=UPI0039E4AB6F
MYFPYFRGKQYELITLREMAADLAGNSIVPILEPVRENHAGLQRCISELRKADVPFVLIINPKHGDFKNDNRVLVDDIVNGELKGYENFQVGYLIHSDSELSDIISALIPFSDRKLALVHYGYPDGAVLANELNTKKVTLESNIFIAGHCGTLYRRHFKGSAKSSVLIKDGFKKEKNADYPQDEEFSELHLTYEDKGVNAFGDFLTVGDDYSESGGPAYAVALHLTYFRKDEVINIKHFVSDRTDSPVDPAGKFLEALQKLVYEVESPGSLVLETSSVREFKQLYSDGHFPGLGYVKKLSMKHHLELMLSFLK